MMCAECDECETLKTEIDGLSKVIGKIYDENIRQESSLKSIHKRLDEDTRLRRDTNQKISDVASNLGIQTQIVKDHMLWEEKFQTLVMWVFVATVGTATTVLTWLVLSVSDLQRKDASNAEEMKSHVETKNRVLKKLDEHSEMMIELMLELKSHESYNREYRLDSK